MSEVRWTPAGGSRLERRADRSARHRPAIETVDVDCDCDCDCEVVECVLKDPSRWSKTPPLGRG